MTERCPTCAYDSDANAFCPDQFHRHYLHRRLTAAMREADTNFVDVGGSTRHFVNDCLLPALAANHVAIMDDRFVAVPREVLEKHVNALRRLIDDPEVLTELTSDLKALLLKGDV